MKFEVTDFNQILQRSVSADGSSPLRTGECQVTDDNSSTTESANKGYSFDNESQWEEVTQILESFGDWAKGSQVKASNATTPNNCKTYLL